MTDLNSSNEFEMKIRRLQKSKKRNLIIKIVLCCIVFATILGYFILPVSRVSNTTVNGNINFTKEQIIQIAGLSSNDSLYLVSKDEIETNLKASPLIDDDSVEVKLSPLGLKINYEEIVPIFSYNDQIYMSNGKQIESDLLQSKDPLVSDYLFVHTQKLMPLFSTPYEEKFTESRLKHLSKLVLSLDEEDKSKIIGVSYDSKNYYFNFYYQSGLEDGTILKVVFDSAKKVEDLLEIIRNDKIDLYISYLSDEKTKDNFVSFEEEILSEKKQIKSIKIVMQTIDDKIYYHVKYNNPTDNGLIEGKEN